MLRRGKWAWALATVLSTVALLPASVDAGTPGPTVSLGKAKGLEYLTAKMEEVVTQAGPPAECGPGKYLTGGGGKIAGPSLNLALNATYPSQSLSGYGWTAEGSTLGASGRTVSSYAICSKAESTVQSSSPFPIGPGNAYAPSEVCTGDAVATGGGVRGVGGRLLIPRTQPDQPPSTPDWSSVVTNAGTGNSDVIDSAVCTVLIGIRVREELGKVKAENAGTVIAKCKAGEPVTGGGFDYLGYDAWAVSTKPWDSKDKGKTPDDGWAAKLYNSSDAAVDVTAFAVCKRRAA